MQVIHTDLKIIVVAAVAVGVVGGNSIAGNILRDCAYAPGVVSISRYNLGILVNDCNYVALQILLEIVRHTVILDAANTVLVVIQGNQSITAPSLSQYFSTVKNIIVSNSIDSLTCADTVGVIGIGIAIKGFELSALLPDKGMTEVSGGIALQIPVYSYSQ